MQHKLQILKKLVRKHTNGLVTHRHLRHRYSCTEQKRQTIQRCYSLYISLYNWPDRCASLAPFIRGSILLQLPGLLRENRNVCQ